MDKEKLEKYRNLEYECRKKHMSQRKEWVKNHVKTACNIAESSELDRLIFEISGDPTILLKRLARKPVPQWATDAIANASAEYLEAGGSKTLDEILGLSSSAPGRNKKPMDQVVIAQSRKEALFWVYWLMQHMGFNLKLACLVVANKKFTLYGHSASFQSSSLEKYHQKQKKLKWGFDFLKDSAVMHAHNHPDSMLTEQNILIWFCYKFYYIWENIVEQQEALDNKKLRDEMHPDEKGFVRSVDAVKDRLEKLCDFGWVTEDELKEWGEKGGKKDNESHKNSFIRDLSTIRDDF